MADPFPDYDVLAKRGTPSWNRRTRAVIDERLALAEVEGVFTDTQCSTLRALAGWIVPQPAGRAQINIVALLLHKLKDRDGGDGFRHARLPSARDAWQLGLDALDAEARALHASAFDQLDRTQAIALLRGVQDGTASHAAWADMPPDLFWAWRLMPDLVSAYWAHPSAWSAMGFGGPASPRGYVRLVANRHDPWEARETPKRG